MNVRQTHFPRRKEGAIWRAWEGKSIRNHLTPWHRQTLERVSPKKSTTPQEKNGSGARAINYRRLNWSPPRRGWSSGTKGSEWGTMEKRARETVKSTTPKSGRGQNEGTHPEGKARKATLFGKKFPDLKTSAPSREKNVTNGGRGGGAGGVFLRTRASKHSFAPKSHFCLLLFSVRKFLSGKKRILKGRARKSRARRTPCIPFRRHPRHPPPPPPLPRRPPRRLRRSSRN